MKVTEEFRPVEGIRDKGWELDHGARGGWRQLWASERVGRGLLMCVGRSMDNRIMRVLTSYKAYVDECLVYGMKGRCCTGVNNLGVCACRPVGRPWVRMD